jgi:GNAT superfamily N-acetyltransferase
MPAPVQPGSEDAGFVFEGGHAGPLRIRASTRDGEVFDRFFAAYDQAFVLPDEKEGRAGFLDCLALNHGESHVALQARYGPFAEWVLVAMAGDEVAGGANFICHAVAGRDGAAVLAMNLNYVFVTPAHRGRGRLRDLVGASRRLAGMSFAGADALPLRMFIELNDPLRMDARAYALDSRVAGIDQFDRVAVWARLGARIVDFPYVQPPLSDGQAADTGLMLGIVDAPGAQLDACVLGGHLERFFAISVLKGGDPQAHPATHAQLQACAARCGSRGGFGLLDPTPHLAALRPLTGQGGHGPGLREHLSDLCKAADAPPHPPGSPP